MKYFICYSVLLHSVNTLKNIVLLTNEPISDAEDIENIEKLLAHRVNSVTNNEFNLTFKDVTIINLVKLDNITNER